MVSLKAIFSLGILGTVASATASTPAELPGCGEINVILAGLPAYHPTVIDLGLDPAMVDRMLHEDAKKVMSLGYNIRVVNFGPETDYKKILDDEMCGIEWHGTGVGYGLRSSKREDLTIELEDVLMGFYKKAPGAEVMFNYNAMTFSWAVQRRFPLSSNCTNSPGKDLGFNVYCDICEQ